jgi:hypothetical protein
MKMRSARGFLSKLIRRSASASGQRFDSDSRIGRAFASHAHSFLQLESLILAQSER